jgi:hypothetical protein
MKNGLLPRKRRRGILETYSPVALLISSFNKSAWKADTQEHKLAESIRRRHTENADMSNPTLTEEITRVWGVNRMAEYACAKEAYPIGPKKTSNQSSD